jgi:hypothetical protein
MASTRNGCILLDHTKLNTAPIDRTCYCHSVVLQDLNESPASDVLSPILKLNVKSK